MNKKGGIYRVSALFAIFLVITIPITNSAVTEVKAYGGTDNIEGIIRQTDFISFVVNTNTNLTNTEIFLNDNIPFDDCYPFAGGTECRLLYPPGLGTTEFQRGFFYQIRSTKGDAAEGRLLVDNLGPEIALARFKEQTRNKVIFDLTVLDYASIRGDTDSCSGIAAITAEGKAPLNPVTPSGCRYESELEFANDFSDGRQTLSFIAFDRFGNPATPRSVVFDIDGTGPEFVEGSMRLVDSRGFPVYRTNGQDSVLTLEVRLTSDEYDKVTADLSEFDGSTRAIGKCSGQTCTWEVPLSIDTSGTTTFSISFEAEDEVGNVGTFTGTWPLTIDNDGPVFLTMEAFDRNGNQLNTSDGNLILGRYTQIVVTLDDSSGFNPQNIYLDLRHLGLGIVPAKSCTGNQCYFEIRLLGSGYLPGTIRTSLDSRDILGNPSLSALSIDIMVDVDDPEFLNFSYSPVEPTIKTDLELKVKVRDATSTPRVKMDAKDISDATYPVEMPCLQDDPDSTVYNCKYTVTNLINKYQEGDIKLEIFDRAGNTHDEIIEVTTFYYEGEVEPDLFTHGPPLPKPRTVDRFLASAADVTLFIEVPLISQVEGAQILDMNVDCSNSSAVLTGSASLIGKNSTSPMIVIQGNSEYFGSEDRSTIPVVCNLLLKVRGRGQLYELWEREEIATRFSLFGFPTGHIDSQIEAKVDDIVDSINQNTKDMEALQKIYDISDTICSIAKPMGIVNGILQGLRTTLAAIACSLDWLASIPELIWKPVCIVTSLMHLITITAIWNPSPVDIYFWPPSALGYMVYNMCAFHYCRWCDPMTIINTGTGLIGDIGGLVSPYDAADPSYATGPDEADRSYWGWGDWSRSPGSEGPEISFEYESPSPPPPRPQPVNPPVLAVFTYTEEDYEQYPWLDPSPGPTAIAVADIQLENKKSDIGIQGYMSFNSVTNSLTNAWSDWDMDLTIGDNRWTLSDTGSALYNFPEGSLDVPPEWWINPYISRYNAESCLCVDGILFSVEKEKRIKCMQIKCIEEHAKVGLPTDSCDIAAQERNCLYVEGAPYYYTSGHFWDGYFENMLEGFMEDIVNQMFNVIGIACKIFKTIPTQSFTDCAAIACGSSWGNLCMISMATQWIMSIDDTMNSLFASPPEKDLGSDNPCDGIEGIE
ncbi:hypothetical protein ACFLZX_01455 [Nanoarchaeota archaeon]